MCQFAIPRPLGYCILYLFKETFEIDFSPFNKTSLQNKFHEIRHEGDLGFPARYISLIKKRELKICCMVLIFVFSFLFSNSSSDKPNSASDSFYR